MRLANVYNLDVSIFAALIYSESSYNINIKHALPYVVGLSGWNLKWWAYADLKQREPKHQLEAGARTLRFYLDKHNGNYLQALWSYKGRGAKGLGLRQAYNVLNIAREIK